VPAAQVKPQEVPSHVAMPEAGGWQGEQLEPQVATLVLETQAPLHGWYPVSQRKAQAPALHCAVACSGGTQGVQLVPQEPMLSSRRHSSRQAWLPGGQVEVVPQVVPSQVAAVLGVVGQGVQRVPQWAALSLLTQTPLQR